MRKLEKRDAVRTRLARPDAAFLSDRAIAREVGVSQPVVSDLRNTEGWPRLFPYQGPRKKNADLTDRAGSGQQPVGYQSPTKVDGEYSGGSSVSLRESPERARYQARSTGDVDVLGVQEYVARAEELVSAEEWHPSRGPRPRIADLVAAGYHRSAQLGWTKTFRRATDDDDVAHVAHDGDPWE